MKDVERYRDVEVVLEFLICLAIVAWVTVVFW
jgi:hypothetical protein